MTDQEYKRAFALLTEKLGRVPTPKDREWVALTEQLRRSYLPAEEEPRRRQGLDGSVSSGRQPREIDAREGTGEALSGPGIITEPVPDRTTPDRPSAPSRIDDGAMVGSRGPAGGIYAKCDGCGRVWERERRRGRPSARCGECQ